MSVRLKLTEEFKRNAKKLAKRYPSFRDDLEVLYDKLEKSPDIGIKIGKGLRKVRLAIKSKNKGKSGGARVITHLDVVLAGNDSEQELALVCVFDKSEKENVPKDYLQQIIDNEL